MTPGRTLFATGLFAAASVMRAQAATNFNYNGENFTDCLNWSSCTSHRIYGYFQTSLSSTEILNLSSSDVTSTITDFSFSDGLDEFTFSSATWFAFSDFGTDIAGNFSWHITICQGGDCVTNGELMSMQSRVSDFGEMLQDRSVITRGSNLSGRGTWLYRDTSAVPEPASWALMLLGFGGIGWKLRDKRSLLLGSIGGL